MEKQMTDNIKQHLEGVLDGVFDNCVHVLEDLVRIPSVSNNATDLTEINRSAQFVLKLFEGLGAKVRLATAPKEHSATGEMGNPAIIGYIGAGEDGEIDESKPTVLLYAHHDVQPAQNPAAWNTPPFEPVIEETPSGLRMYGRGAADDGAGIISHYGAISLYQKLGEKLPVNLKIYIEGEEEVGSPSFDNFVKLYADELKADLIIVADSGNWAVGTPAITATLRGVATINLELQVLEHTIHSGMSSGPIIDANALLMRTINSIWDERGNVQVAGILGAKGFEQAEPTIDFEESTFRSDNGVLPGVELTGEGSIAGRVWLKPSVTVIGFDAVPVEQASNVFANIARARLSLRIAPGQDSNEAAQLLVKHLEENVPFGAKFNAYVLEAGPAFKANVQSKEALAFKDALESAFEQDVVYSGMGGSIPFTATLGEVFPDAEIIISGVEDPDSRAHSDNESVHLGDLKKLILAGGILFDKLTN
jgi:acetylornithine deacetylase/succinyl-diaminopimelate desuccinylase-like protein